MTFGLTSAQHVDLYEIVDSSKFRPSGVTFVAYSCIPNMLSLKSLRPLTKASYFSIWCCNWNTIVLWYSFSCLNNNWEALCNIFSQLTSLKPALIIMSSLRDWGLLRLLASAVNQTANNTYLINGRRYCTKLLNCCLSNWSNTMVFQLQHQIEKQGAFVKGQGDFKESILGIHEYATKVYQNYTIGRKGKSWEDYEEEAGKDVSK